MIDRWSIMKEMEFRFVEGFISKFTKEITIIEMGPGRGELMRILERNGYKPMGIDLSPWNSELVMKRDMRNSNLQEKSVDIIYCVSTICNIGLGGYGDFLESNGDRSAIEEFMRILKDDGRILLTFPYGESGIRIVGANYRVYDKDLMKILIEDLEIEEEHFFFWCEDKWIETIDESILKQIFLSEEKIPKGVVFLVLKKVLK